MKRVPNRWVLFQRPREWSFARLENNASVLHHFSTDESCDLNEFARRVAALAAERGYSGEGIVLALDSMSCIVNFVAAEDKRLLRQRQALTYAFEAELPIPVEELTVDFALSEGGAFGVAVQTQLLAPILDALQNQGLQVQAIVPVTILAVQHLISSNRLQDDRWIAWEDEDRIELISIRAGSVTSWKTIRNDALQLVQHVGMMRRECTEQVKGVVCSPGGSLQQALAERLSDAVDFLVGPTLVDAAILSGDELLRGKFAPWIDLRRDALAPSDPYRPVRGLLNTIAIALLALLIVTNGMLWYRASSYQSTAAAYQKAQEEVFRELLPGQRLPRGILRVLESEYAKASGLRGQRSDLPEYLPLLLVVREALSALPQGLRFRINELRIERDRLDLDGEVRTHADADALATALRRQGFEVASPRSQQLPNTGVGIRLTAQYRRPKADKVKTDSEDESQGPPEESPNVTRGETQQMPGLAHHGVNEHQVRPNGSGVRETLFLQENLNLHRYILR